MGQTSTRYVQKWVLVIGLAAAILLSEAWLIQYLNAIQVTEQVNSTLLDGQGHEVGGQIGITFNVPRGAEKIRVAGNFTRLGNNNIHLLVEEPPDFPRPPDPNDTIVYFDSGSLPATTFNVSLPAWGSYSIFWVNPCSVKDCMANDSAQDVFIYAHLSYVIYTSLTAFLIVQVALNWSSIAGLMGLFILILVLGFVVFGMGRSKSAEIPAVDNTELNLDARITIGSGSRAVLSDRYEQNNLAVYQ